MRDFIAGTRVEPIFEYHTDTDALGARAERVGVGVGVGVGVLGTYPPDSRAVDRD
jgi:hypothetical protein